jgi:hypothetical protein
MATCKGWTMKGSIERVLEWCPLGRRRKGRPRNSWMQEVTTGMRERKIGDLEWVDREGWRMKINLA